MSRFILLCLAVLLVPASVAAQDGKAAFDPNQAYAGSRSNPVTYDVDLSVIVTPPYKAKKLRVWLPIPPSDAVQEVSDRKLTSFPMAVTPVIGTEKKYGNTFAYFEFDKPEGAQIIRHQFKVKTHEVDWNIDPDKVVRVDIWPGEFGPYLDPDKSVAVNDTLRQVLKDVVPEPRGPGKDLATVMGWVNANLKYDHVNASLKASSQHALGQRCGHCSDYHGLCAAFGRALGFPTRVTYGINPFPKNSPSHCKLEAYLPPYGWASFDVSETQKLVADIGKLVDMPSEQKEKLKKAATDRLLRGYRDNTWFLQTRGTDYDLVPPAAQKAPVVRTIYAEADGVALQDPDPANDKQKGFAWMTVHKYTPDKVVPYPFKDWKTLEKK